MAEDKLRFIFGTAHLWLRHGGLNKDEVRRGIKLAVILKGARS
jgi:hypothetical protein